MDREKHFEAALQHLRRAIALLISAGEDRLAVAIEEIVDWSDFLGRDAWLVDPTLPPNHGSAVVLSPTALRLPEHVRLAPRLDGRKRAPHSAQQPRG